MSFIEQIRQAICSPEVVELNHLKESIKEYEDWTSDLVVANHLVQTELDKVNAYVASLKPDVMDAKYWENKWASRRVYYNHGTSSNPLDVLKVSEQDEQILMPTVLDIIEKYNLSSNDVDAVPLAVMKWLDSSNFKYQFDSKTYNKNEYWAKAVLTHETMIGDCDDAMVLEYCLVRLILQHLEIWQDHAHRFKCVAGNVNTPIGRYVGGHAYLVWLHSDGKWYTVETTYNLKNAIKSFGVVAQKYNSMYGTIWFTFNERGSYAQHFVSISSGDFKK